MSLYVLISYHCFHYGTCLFASVWHQSTYTILNPYVMSVLPYSITTTYLFLLCYYATYSLDDLVKITP